MTAKLLSFDMSSSTSSTPLTLQPAFGRLQREKDGHSCHTPLKKNTPKHSFNKKGNGISHVTGLPCYVYSPLHRPQHEPEFRKTGGWQPSHCCRTFLQPVRSRTSRKWANPGGQLDFGVCRKSGSVYANDISINNYDTFKNKLRKMLRKKRFKKTNCILWRAWGPPSLHSLAVWQCRVDKFFFVPSI